MMAKGKIISDEPHRAELAAAITDAEAARRALEIARTAAGNAENRMYEAHARLDEVRQLEPENASPDRMLESLASADASFDVLALEMPDAPARARAEKAEHDIAAWRRAHDIAEKAIPDRQQAAEQAQRKVEIAARVVIGSSFDVDQMISDAEEAAAAIVEKCIMLMYLRPFLDNEGARASIERFLSRSWLEDEGSDAWKDHPAVVAHRDAHAELLLDAAAPLPA
jgi:hypothetical protein